MPINQDKKKGPKPKKIYYAYKGENVFTQKAVKGVKGAYNRDDAIQRLKLDSIEVKELTEQPDPFGINGIMYLELPKSSKPNKKEICSFFDSLSFLLSSGLSNMEALDILATSSPEYKIKIQAVRVGESIKLGHDLATALKLTKFYDESTISQVNAGLTSGALTETLNRLIVGIESELELNAKLKSAATYPIFILTAMVGILWAMLNFVIPKMAASIVSMGGTMPALTQFLIDLSTFVQAYSIYIFIGVVLIVVAIVQTYKRVLPLRKKCHEYFLKIPVAGPLLMKTDLSRFCRSYAAMQQCNIPIIESLNTVAGAIKNYYIRDAVIETADLIAMNGYSLLEAMKRTKRFPYDMLSLIGVGVASGSIVEICNKLSSRYETEVDRLVKTLTSLMEPLMIIIIGGVVGTVVVAMYLPMFSLIETV